MNRQIKEIFERSEGRYFTESEAAQLTDYADGLLARLDTMAAVQRAESVIVEAAVSGHVQQWRGMKDENGPLADKLAARDFTLFLRYAAVSHLLLDPDRIYDKLAVWYRTIIFSLVRPQMVVSGFRRLIDAMGAHLTPDDARGLIPYIEIVLVELESNAKKEAA